MLSSTILYYHITIYKFIQRYKTNILYTLLFTFKNNLDIIKKKGDSMYDYIKGIVTKVKASGIVIETGGIGYFIHTPNPYVFDINKENTIYLYQVVKEDELSLYGFIKEEEKELFLKLIGVKGLGPKMALPIIATGGVGGIIDAIDRENILYLKKFPKIGDKLAKQIILDLKGKLGSIDVDKSDIGVSEELHEALISLGYKEKEIKSVIPKVDNKLSIENQIKEALKLLLK